MDSTPLHSTQIIHDLGRLGCGESSGVHMEYGGESGDRKDLCQGYGMAVSVAIGPNTMNVVVGICVCLVHVSISR